MNNNFDENTMNNIKNMVDSGDINGAISQISPEMIQNFSKMLSQTQNGNSNNNGSSNSNSNGYQNNTSNNFANGFTQNNSNNNGSGNGNSNGNGNGNGNANNFDFSNIDMNAVMKMASNLNSSNRNDPRGNLLSALKPYMRNSKKGKMDNYMNLLNMAKMADIFKNNSNNMPNSNQEKH